MTAETTLLEIPGGKVLFDWFGHVPSFHDAELLEINLVSKGLSTLRIHTWEMTDKVDTRGYFALDRHVVVTITLEEVTHVDLVDFNMPGIIGGLQVTKIDEDVQFAWDGSYGVAGVLRAKKAYFDLKAGKP